VAADGLRARDVLVGQCVQAPVSVVPAASAGEYDLILVAVRADQIKTACAQLTDLAGRPVPPVTNATRPRTLPGPAGRGWPAVCELGCSVVVIACFLFSCVPLLACLGPVTARGRLAATE
jgi:hypothetical protein